MKKQSYRREWLSDSLLILAIYLLPSQNIGILIISVGCFVLSRELDRGKL